MNQAPLETIAEAFSRTAEKYDSFAEDHPHLTRMRDKVYSHVMRYVPQGARILELNAGTGTDAVQLAQRGYHIHATDIAPGMLKRLHEKVIQLDLQNRVTMQTRSFLSLDNLQGAPFDAVFSDLGGLNCVPDLTPVIRQLPHLLKPAGTVTWVLMPHICLWEIAEVFRGNVSLAFRRLSRGKVRANLEGLHFDVYYFSPGQLIQWFGKKFELLALEGLSVITPTAESKNFARGHPHLYHVLSWLDDKLSPHWPWYGWGDFYILTMRYKA
ncbi:MAG TPA: class I SAM-dependent methyltransferase [Anaerolineales bacterium]|jgi:ubiquinone/menaquinone biosynthesis C-methylase UbiE|nr:class I SAM-dependent methyltransferase [Anaerolineales bacterium]